MPPAAPMKSEVAPIRLKALRAQLDAVGADGFVGLSEADTQWLTGFLADFLGEPMVVIVAKEEALFLCDPRYTEQAQEEVSGYAVEEVRGNLLVGAGERLKQLQLSTVAFDPAYMTVAQHSVIAKGFQGTLKPVPNLVAGLRMVKSAGEVDRIRAASQLAESVLADLVPAISAGLTEAELAARFEFEVKKLGARGAAFPTIALFGPRSSLPHGQPGSRALQPADIVLLDLGCRLDGYCSDLTRTYAFGMTPGAWFEEIYQVTLTAQLAAIKAVKPGTRCRDVDAVARSIIANAGYGDHFGHGLGHGVGIEIHEGPRLNFESETELKPGMIITIEPGIYLPGRGGVRIEDLAVVTETGCALLSSTPKELRVLG